MNTALKNSNLKNNRSLQNHSPSPNLRTLRKIIYYAFKKKQYNTALRAFEKHHLLKQSMHHYNLNQLGSINLSDIPIATIHKWVHGLHKHKTFKPPKSP